MLLYATGDQPAYPPPQLHYVVQNLSDEMTVEIRFDHKTEDQAQQIYFGPHLMLSYDNISMSADEIHCGRSIEVCTASGNVSIVIGAEVDSGTALRLDIPNRKITLTREPVITKTF
jgi:hypothetical protein